jgi:hypothetical protein
MFPNNTENTNPQFPDPLLRPSLYRSFNRLRIDASFGLYKWKYI